MPVYKGTSINNVIERKYMKFDLRDGVEKLILKSYSPVCMRYYRIHQAIVYGLRSSDGCKICPLSPKTEASSWFCLMYLLHRFKVFVLYLDGTVSHSVSCIMENGGLEYLTENHPLLTYNPIKN